MGVQPPATAVEFTETSTIVPIAVGSTREKPEEIVVSASPASRRSLSDEARPARRWSPESVDRREAVGAFSSSFVGGTELKARRRWD